MDFTTVAKMELNRVLSQIEEYDRILKNLPEGLLHRTARKSGDKYCCIMDGKMQYIGTEDKPLIRQLKSRRFAQHAMKILTEDEKLLVSLIEKYEPYSPEYIMSTIPLTYRTGNPDIIDGIDFINADEWANAPYRQSSDYAGQLTHMTLKGHYVRSKSEAIIANMLYSKGIPYRYEEELVWEQSVITPDFIVAVPSEGRIKILEHFGMMFEPRYRNSAAWKVSQYIAHGFMPLDNIFFTYEDMNGNIDTRLIESVIDNNFR